MYKTIRAALRTLVVAALGLGLGTAAAAPAASRVPDGGVSMGQHKEYVEAAAELLKLHSAELAERVEALTTKAKEDPSLKERAEALDRETLALIYAVDDWIKHLEEEGAVSAGLGTWPAVLRERVGAVRRALDELQGKAAMLSQQRTGGRPPLSSDQVKALDDQLDQLEEDLRFFFRERPCYALRDDRGDQAYIIIFDELKRTFDYPKEALYEDMDVILCVEEADRAYRYQVSVGSTTSGGDTDGGGVSAVVSTDLSTSLQLEAGSDDGGVDCDGLYMEALEKKGKELRLRAEKDKNLRKELAEYDEDHDAAYFMERDHFHQLWDTCMALSSARDELIANTQLILDASAGAADLLVRSTNQEVDEARLDKLAIIDKPICQVPRTLDAWLADYSDRCRSRSTCTVDDALRIPRTRLVHVWDGACTGSPEKPAPSVEDIKEACSALDKAIGLYMCPETWPSPSTQPTTDVREEATKLPLARALDAQHYRWVGGQVVYNDSVDETLFQDYPELERLKKSRDSVAANLGRAVSTYQQISAHVADYVKYGYRRQLTFNLGRFSENTLIAGSLTARALVFNYDQQRGTSLVREVATNTYGFSAVVREARWYGVQPGFMLSTLPVRKYELVPEDTAAEDTASFDNTVLQTESGRFSSPGVFVNFYACATDLRQSFWKRTCKGNQDSYWRYVPSLAVGVPVSSEFAEGHLFFGVGLPYVPYVNIVVGGHLGRVDYVSEAVLQSGTSYTAINRVVYDRVGIAPFFAINASAEILGALFPTLKPAR